MRPLPLCFLSLHIPPFARTLSPLFSLASPDHHPAESTTRMPLCSLTKRKSRAIQAHPPVVSTAAAFPSAHQCMPPDVPPSGSTSPPRRRRVPCRVAVRLQHAMSTPIHSVGLQVWAASLLLCDWLASDAARSHLKPDCLAVELGAGAGLAACVAAQLGADVIATDVGEHVLRNLQTNVDRNTLPGAGRLRVRSFDWCDPAHPLFVRSAVHGGDENEGRSSKPQQEGAVASEADDEGGSGRGTTSPPSKRRHQDGHDGDEGAEQDDDGNSSDPFAWTATDVADVHTRASLILAADGTVVQGCWQRSPNFVCFRFESSVYGFFLQ